jgi:nucleoside-diphosphate-sugar epimerase
VVFIIGVYNMRYVVTGGAGFIGSHIAERLLSDGHDVIVIDDLSTGRKKNIKPFLSHSSFRFVEGSITSLELLLSLFTDVDAVFHQAAIPSVPRSVKDPVTSHEANINGSLCVLEAAKQCCVRRVLFASSSSVYGDSPVMPKQEDMEYNPLSPYAVQKMTTEMYCKVYYELYGLETVAIRYFNVFGERQNPESTYAAVIPKFITALLAGESPTIFGDGEQSRDFTYIDNVVHANMLALSKKEAAGTIMNVACGGRYTLNDLVVTLNQLCGTNIEAIHAKERAGDIKHSLADITRATRILDYKPIVSFEDGLQKTIDFFNT